MNALQDCLDIEPTAPKGLPAWRAIPFAAQVSPKAGNGIPTLLTGQCLRIAVVQIRYYCHDVSWQDLAGEPLRFLPGYGSQLQQAHRHRSQHPQQGAQAVIVLQVTVLDLAAGF